MVVVIRNFGANDTNNQYLTVTNHRPSLSKYLKKMMTCFTTMRSINLKQRSMLNAQKNSDNSNNNERITRRPIRLPFAQGPHAHSSPLVAGRKQMVFSPGLSSSDDKTTMSQA